MSPAFHFSRDDRLALILIGGLTLARLAAALASPLDLYADEAQYWRWGQSLAWGYYSKPPMIAWVLHVASALFGDGEPAVRLAAPLLHAVAAGFIYLLGRTLLTARAGLWAALTYALMPAVTLSSAVISTDGVLMPFWCAGLYCLWRLRSGAGGWATALGIGVAIGGGLLAKYAMLYFLIGMALACLIDAPTRRALFSRNGLIALGMATALFAPHVAWNAANDFKTVSHTVDNANLGGDLFNPENALTFMIDQTGVFGPVAFLTLLAGLAFVRSRNTAEIARERWLLCFILPVLIFIFAQAVISRAHANWAATAYPAASLLVVAWLMRAAPNRYLWWGIAALCLIAALLIPDFTTMARLGIGSVLGGGIALYGLRMGHRPAGLIGAGLAFNLLIALVFVSVALLPAAVSGGLGLDNAMKRSRGWSDASAAIYAAARAEGATAILVDEREVWHGLDYYGRDQTLPLISWRRYPGPKSFSEAEPLTDALAGRVLVASLHADLRPHLRGDFRQFEPLTKIVIPLGKRANGCPITRTFQLYIASGYSPPERSAAWEARFKGQEEFPDPACSVSKTEPAGK
jgi:Dolichyl-phosphate-mannose-protein mannosyltransferase